ncbi:MAG: DUF1207 domain-containing protein [Parachlamydiales bacterium]
MADDTYIEGYLQALIDEHFGEYHINVCVEGCTVILSHMPNNCEIVRDIVQFVRDFPGVNCVVVDRDCLRCRPVKHPTPYQDCYRLNGVWFPQRSVLFKYLVADPRQIRFGAGYRFHDDVFGSRIGCATFGNIFPIFRWIGVGPMCGDMQISIEGGVFAIFQFDPVAREVDGDSVALVNADYVVGIPLTYAYGNWSYRLRLYHQSSHLGDEFLVNRPGFVRLNPSREALELFASWQPNDAIRLYGGAGWVYHSNDGYKIKPFYVAYGFEMRLPGSRDLYQCLYYKPLLAVYIQNWQDVGWNFDANYVLGIEWSKVRGLGQKMRTYFEYHDGFSHEGQFSKLRTSYFSVNISFGW